MSMAQLRRRSVILGDGTGIETFSFCPKSPLELFILNTVFKWNPKNDILLLSRNKKGWLFL